MFQIRLRLGQWPCVAVLLVGSSPFFSSKPEGEGTRLEAGQRSDSGPTHLSRNSWTLRFEVGAGECGVLES